MLRPFFMIDVFGTTPFSGNPLAVVMDADGLTTEEMLSITRWLNLSETTFVLKSQALKADYRVRIFTPDREMPFAGHPTLGTCRAWLEHGGVPKQGDEIVQDCGAGLVRIRQDGDLLAFAAPPLIRSGPVAATDLAEVASVLRIPVGEIVDAAWADNGPGWIAVRLASAEAVLALEPDTKPGKRFDIGVVGPHGSSADVAFEVRAFFSDHNGDLREDPVTGSLNASVAQWLLGSGVAEAPYVAAQGTRLDRSGRVYITQADGEVWIGGRTQVMFEGKTV